MEGSSPVDQDLEPAGAAGASATTWRRAMHGNAMLTLPAWSTPLDDSQMFDLAPVALCLEDYSALKALFRQWRARGVSDLRQFLSEDVARIALCFRMLRIVKVNRQTLRLFEVEDLETFNNNLQTIFPIYAGCPHVEQLVQMWSGQSNFSFNSVDYSFRGRAVDLRVHGAILPGHETDWARVLLALEDVTVLEQARRELTVSERYAHSLFEKSPAALFVQDCQLIKEALDELRRAGLTDLRAHLARYPDFALKCLRSIRVVDANQTALTLFRAPDKATLIGRMAEVMREDMLPNLVEELITLWDGVWSFRRETVNYPLEGPPLDVLVQVSVLPGHEADWSKVLVAVTDITARKQAEAHLEFLSRYDSLTGLQNRAAYVEQLGRFDRQGPYPVTVMIIDLDGLKGANDRFGHAVGDDLLRRCGRVLAQATAPPGFVARIGGDEFALVIPATEAAGASRIVDRIGALVARDNEAAPGNPLRLSIGTATCDGPDCLDRAIREADLRMYEAKRATYAALGTAPAGR